ncbi:YkvA family protein [Numidum massiliense]|uniref:YkvA family protein n=1 Tax=Numidum massiliense TaxID=1522315 RepID=UPI0006D52CC0|nr:YkvA family protein [Numidum massiliense]
MTDSCDPFEANGQLVAMNKKEQRFYDRLRKQLSAKIKQWQEKLGNRAAEYLLLLPDLFVLFVRLVRDARVPKQAKVLAGVALAYIVSPIDIIPDFLGGIGWLDDIVLAVYAVKRILVDVDQRIVKQYWTGESDLLSRVQEVIAAADRLIGSRVVHAIQRKLAKAGK